jgi:hypothetical protein
VGSVIGTVKGSAMRAIPKRVGLGRVDLLAALAVLLASAGVAVPAVYQANAKKDRNDTVNNLKLCGLAVHNCHDTYNKLPQISGPLGAKDSTLHFHLLPFLERASIYNNDDLSASIEVLGAAGDRSALTGGVYKRVYGSTNFPGNWLVFKGGPSAPGFNTLAQIVNGNGTSNTITFAERYQMCNGTPCLWGYSQYYYWAPMFAYFSRGKFQIHPPQEACDPALPQSMLREGIAVGMVDGSVRVLGNDLGADIWGHALDPANATIFQLPGG